MQVEQKDAVAEIFCDVLEKLAFMFADPLEKKDVPVDEEEYFEVLMGFFGQMQGDIVLAAPARICAEIAANVLGLDPEDPEAAAQGTDTLKELLNVTCGNVLTALAGEEPVFDLLPPVLSRLDTEGWKQFVAREDSIAFDVDSTAILLWLSVRV